MILRLKDKYDVTKYQENVFFRKCTDFYKQCFIEFNFSVRHNPAANVFGRYGVQFSLPISSIKRCI